MILRRARDLRLRSRRCHRSRVREIAIVVGLRERDLRLRRWHFRDINELNAVNDLVFAMNDTLNSEDAVGSRTPTKAYLDLSVAGDTPRRVVIELASAALPKTTENFRRLCQEKGGEGGLGYESTLVYKIEKTVGLCLGDVVSNDGTGGRCYPSFGTYASPYSFEDEGFLI